MSNSFSACSAHFQATLRAPLMTELVGARSNVDVGHRVSLFVVSGLGWWPGLGAPARCRAAWRCSLALVGQRAHRIIEPREVLPTFAREEGLEGRHPLVVGGLRAESWRCWLAPPRRRSPA